MIFKDYYKILELKTNRVSSEEIKNAYRLAVKKNHPDLNVEDKLAEEKIKDINEAYKVLSESSSKRKYDRIWNKNNMKIKQQQYKEENKKNNASFGEFFNMFFGTTENIVKPKINKQEKNPINGENIETSIDVDIEEVFYGLDKKISLGIDGGKNGDLFIKVNIKDSEKFKLKGNDLYTNLYLTPWEAALGTRTTVYSIDDGTVVYIPEGMETGEILKISGKGYKDGKGGRGDLIAKVNIMVPKKLSEQEKAKDSISYTINTKMAEINKLRDSDNDSLMEQKIAELGTLITQYKKRKSYESSLQRQRNSYQSILQYNQAHSLEDIAFENDRILALIENCIINGRVYFDAYNANKIVVENFNKEVGLVDFKTTISVANLLTLIENINYYLDDANPEKRPSSLLTSASSI